MPKNPFPFSAPVSIDDLIDREQEAKQLLDNARSHNNSRLTAPRRYGKTSLMQQVVGAARSDGWAAVYVDFFGVVTLADVAERIERAYADGLTGRAARWFAGLRRLLKPSVTFGGGPLPVSGQVDLGPAAAPLLERLALPRKVHERWGTPVLVVFDEFQELLTAQSNADAVIRSEIQHHGDAASYVFAGSHLGMMTELFTDRRRAFYAQAAPVALPPLPADATAEFVADRFTGSGKDIGDALDGLLALSSGHPQRTMLLAAALWDVTPAKGQADPALLAAAHERLLAELADEFRTFWSLLSVTQRRVLAAVASGERPYARPANRPRAGGGTRAGLEALRGRGDLTEDPAAASGWRVIDPLLEAWVRASRSNT
ncbi:MAG: AAA family ATPase [Mycobacteriales bacterium]